MKKQYTFGNVVCGYSPSSRKWEFTVDKFTLLTALKGGAATAEKIANIVSGASKRTKGNGLDGLARNNINTVLKRVELVA
jgi:hypothetical protein